MSDIGLLASIDPFRLGLRLEAARIAAGLSVGQAARITGFTREQISKWEMGKGTISAPAFSRLTETYGVKAEDLLAAPLAFDNDDVALDAYRHGRLSGDEFMRWMALDHIHQRLWAERRVALECPHCTSTIYVLPDEPLPTCWRCGISLLDIDKACFDRAVLQ